MADTDAVSIVDVKIGSILPIGRVPTPTGILNAAQWNPEAAHFPFPESLLSTGCRGVILVHLRVGDIRGIFWIEIECHLVALMVFAGATKTDRVSSSPADRELTVRDATRLPLESCSIASLDSGTIIIHIEPSESVI